MKTLLSRIKLQKALGVYLGEHEIAISLAATTPLGVKELAQQRIAYAGENYARILPEALSSFLGRRRRALPVVVGLATSRVFFAAQSIAGLAESELTSEALLQKLLCSPTLRIKDYIIDLLRIDTGKTPVACLTATRRKYVFGLVGALKEQGIRPARVEPGPWGLLRLALKYSRATRRVKNVLRIFLSDVHGLAVLTTENVPVAWRNLALSPGEEQAAIVCAVRILQTLTEHYNIGCPPDMLVIHGRPELHAQFREPAFAEAMGMDIVCYDQPEMDSASMAFGLALGALKAPRLSCDLSASLKPPPSLWELFPRGEFALEAALVASMGVLLWIHARNLETSYQKAQDLCRRYQCVAASDEAKLSKEKKDLEQKVGTVRKFLESRILWSNYAGDLPRWIPKEIQLLSFTGESRVEIGDKKDKGVKAKKMLIVRGGIPIQPTDTSPPQIDDFLAALRGYRPLQQDFPNIELTDIKLAQSTTDTPPMVSFNVVCSPPTGKGAASTENKEKKNKKAKE